MGEAALRSFCMLAEPGEAVREWASVQKHREMVAVRRREAPQASICAVAPSKAATEGRFFCKECGAVFSLEKTLKKHLQLHKDEQQGIARTLLSAAPATESSWRQSTYEESAVYNAELEWDDELQHDQFD